MLPMRRHRRLAAVLVLLGAAGAAIAAPAGTSSGPSTAGRSSAAPECELQVTRGVGSVELLALAHAASGAEGEYDLRVSGRGTNIRQGGPFATGPGGTAELGMVTLGGGGAAYVADLDIKVGGKTVSCSRRIGGGI